MDGRVVAIIVIIILAFLISYGLSIWALVIAYDTKTIQLNGGHKPYKKRKHNIFY